MSRLGRKFLVVGGAAGTALAAAVANCQTGGDEISLKGIASDRSDGRGCRWAIAQRALIH